MAGLVEQAAGAAVVMGGYQLPEPCCRAGSCLGRGRGVDLVVFVFVFVVVVVVVRMVVVNGSRRKPSRGRLRRVQHRMHQPLPLGEGQGQ